MDELDRLRIERDRLRAQEDVERQQQIYEGEKRDLKRQIFQAKHKKTIKVVRTVGGVAKRSIVGVGMILGSVGRKAQPYLERGAINFAEGMNGSPRREKTTRRIKKRVKRGGKKKRKVIKRVVRRSQSNQFPNFNNFFG